ncbi:unnamed protein product [Ranitomeya imitator]|uniref:Tubulin delta chain n=1 Tax=Ranitomeya imitator TaxID=111125 RepID=A0ABN9LA53_9NEOB|nr:unnamed protein product [Ranitomeya imitator]
MSFLDALGQRNQEKTCPKARAPHHRERHADRESDTQTERATRRQRERHADRESDTQTERDAVFYNGNQGKYRLGQCGNQIGYELFDAICNDFHSNGLCPRKENGLYQAASKERFFDETKSGDFVSRAVLLDMEPKVISQTLSMAAHSGKWKYSDKSQFSQKQGSGNNWANGFYAHGPKHKDFIMNLVRKETEKCDRLGGFITIMSMAGGTGSGMGTFITRCLRDVYPNALLLNEVIWPYGTGEVNMFVLFHS